ncbi:MAG: GNAT family N-acetyltransferase [Candidatus Hodarchaeales archaeon]|jgi:ribosomal protein S18 acetylase RimI-like enzyme
MTPTKEINPKLTFRPLTVDDVDTIVKIDEKILRRKRSELFHNQLRDQIIKHGEESFGAFTSDEVLVGYLIAETVVYIYGTDDLSAWIILLGVDPNYQDQGVGTALMKQVVNYFTEKGIKTIRTICAWNWGDLVEFFSSVGFNLSTYLTLELDIG